jgi:hypothetical protein
VATRTPPRRAALRADVHQCAQAGRVITAQLACPGAPAARQQATPRPRAQAAERPTRTRSTVPVPTPAVETPPGAATVPATP